jgi:hypothetical protein
VEPGKSTGDAEASDEFLEAPAVAGVFWEELVKGIFEPETGEDGRSTMA